MVYDYKKNSKKNAPWHTSIDPGRENVFSIKNKSNKDIWWIDNKDKEHKKDYGSDIKEINKNNIRMSSATRKEGEKLRDIPDQMGYFETETVGTISVGFNRYNKKGDLGFTVVSEKDKDKNGIPERDENDPNTFFGGNFDGKEKPFKVGAISFRYNKREKEIDKIKKNKNESNIHDEKELLYQDEKEEEKLKSLQKQKWRIPSQVEHLRREEEKIKKIKDKKRKENDDFLKEIEEFICKLKDGKIKMLVEADEAAKRRRRIIELSSDFYMLEQMRKRLKELMGKDNVEDLLAFLLKESKLRCIDEKELLKIINSIRKEV